MAQRGGISHIHYKETKGLKVASGQFVKKGSILTREGNKWRAGINIGGKGTLYAKADGIIYFTKRKDNYRNKKLLTVININPVRDKSLNGVKEIQPAKKEPK